MTLAALIAAYHNNADAGGGLRATLPLAGRTLVERQARLAASAGATPIIIAADRPPPELLAAAARLRADGLEVVIAGHAAEAGRAVQADDRILLIADGVLAGEADIARLLSVEGPALLTVPDTGHDDRFERIDAASRWAGLAVVSGQLLKHTAAMLQDWDLQSTLLRRAVQTGARHVAIEPGAQGHRLVAAERAADLAPLQSHILEQAGSRQSDWVSRHLLALLEIAATRRLLPTPATSGQVWLANLVLVGISALAFSRGWLWPGLAAFLLATPIAGVAERLGHLRGDKSRHDDWLSRLMPPVAGAALLALGYALWPVHGWGTVVLALCAIAFILALQGEAPDRGRPSTRFLAEPKAMGWLMLPFAAAGQWVAGLGALALYAAGSFFWAQRGRHVGEHVGGAPDRGN